MRGTSETSERCGFAVSVRRMRTDLQTARKWAISGSEYSSMGIILIQVVLSTVAVLDPRIIFMSYDSLISNFFLSAPSLNYSPVLFKIHIGPVYGRGVKVDFRPYINGAALTIA
jgi:hypothetical protein